MHIVCYIFINRDAVIRDMQAALDQAVSERETLEVRLNESLSTKMDGSLYSNRKVLILHVYTLIHDLSRLIN